MLGWNGIGERAAVLPLAKYISHSEVLEYLDLSYNRFVSIVCFIFFTLWHFTPNIVLNYNI